jgi:hypothetical protein
VLDEQLDLLLSYVLAHKMAFTQDFLRERGLPFTGTKDQLRRRLEGYLSKGQIDPADLTELLNEVEGWGDQHIYSYQAPDKLIEPWLEEASVRRHLAGLGLERLLGRQRPVVLPEKATLSSILWTRDRIRFVWVEPRQWVERIQAHDLKEPGMVWRAYAINVTRSLISFDWDLISGHGWLMIQQPKRGREYRSIRNRFERLLDPIIEIRQFDRVRVSRAIHRIQASDEVRRRQVEYLTTRGGTAEFTSAGEGRDVFSDDPDLYRAGQALGGDAAGLQGSFYWTPVPGSLAREVYTKIYESDQRVAIFAEHSEQDVRYVLSRIQHYCRQASSSS